MTWVKKVVAAILMLGSAACSRAPDATTAAGPSPAPSHRDPALGEKAVPPGPVAARPGSEPATPAGKACEREGEECP